MARDFRRLKQEANILDVLHALGYSEGGDGPKSIKRMGQNYFVHCPVPSHNDAHMSCRCKQGWPNLLCESCRTSTYGIDLIMYETGCSELEAADQLWKIEGCPDWYKASDKKGSTRFNLTWKEQNLIGFFVPTGIETPETIYSFKPKDLEKDERVNPEMSYFDRNLDYHYVSSKRIPVEMKDFLPDEMFTLMARNKAILKKRSLIAAYKTALNERKKAQDTSIWDKELSMTKADLIEIQAIIDKATLFLKKSQR